MSGTIRSAGQVDSYSFVLTGGFSYEFDLFGQGSGSGTLAGASLNFVGHNTATEGADGDARITYTAPSSGIYQFRVSASGSNTGTYSLEESPPDDYGDTNATAGTLAIGGSTTGTIKPIGDDDLFAVTVVAGYAYQFDLLGQGAGGGTLAGATLQLIPTFGNNVSVTEGTTGDARISYTATASGTYYLDVSGATGTTGSYTLTAQAADDFGDTRTTAGSLAVGGSTTGTIKPIGDDDLFAVTVVAGYAYQFDLLGQGAGGGTLAGATLQLIPTFGNNVSVTEGSTGDARISYTATASGTYYLDVSGATGTTGSYTLTAATVVAWKSGISGDWSTAADWSTNAVPGSTNAVTIAASGSYIVTVSAPEAARSLNLAAAGAVLEVGATLTISYGLTASQGTISIAAGQVLTLSSALNLGATGFNGPTIDGPGEISTSGPTSLVTQTSTGFRDLLLGNGITWVNTGTVTDAGLIKFGVGANDAVSLVNQAGGVLNLTTDDADLIASASTDTATLSNAGTLEKTGGTGTSTIAVAVTNTGTIAITTGTLLLSGGLVNNGVLHAFAGGTLDVTGPVAGSGHVVIDQGATVEIGGAASEAVVFTGAGTLQLDAPATFTGAIYGFTPGAEIVLGGTQVISINVSGSSLTANLAGGGSYTLSVDGLKSASGLTLANNVLTGTVALVSTAPDLVVSNVTAPATAVAGLPTTLTWTETNQSAVTATGPWVDEIFLVSDAAGDNAQLVGSLQYNGALTGSQAVARTLTVTVPAATSGNEYFLVKADALNQVANDGVGPERQGISSAVDFIPTTIPVTPVSISQITPTSGSDLGNVTVTVTGANFNANDQVTIIGGGQTLSATQVFYVSSGKLWATFNLTSLPVGTYRVQVGDAASTATSPGTFQVNSNPAGKLSVNLVLPTTTSASQTPTGTVTYTNTGATDIAAPLLDVSSTQALLKAPGDTTGSDTLEFLGTNPNGPAGILQPGASGTYAFTYTPTALTLTGNVTVSVGAAQPSTAIDWASQEAALKPATVDATDWNNVYTQFEALVGTTTDSLDAALSRAASELSQVGQSTNDVATLLQYELFLASGALAGGTLAATTDIAATSSPFSLSLGRLYHGTLLDRDATGTFGNGWTSTYDVRSVTDTNGNVTIQSPGALHIFTRQTNGTYAAQSGDPATLTVSAGLYRMNDGAVDILQFNASGQLAGITDANGNLTSLTYGSNGVLQRVSSQATSETITFASNAASRITSATDSNGQTVTYNYDATNTLLLSATGPAGTTTYGYAPVTGSAQDNVLTSVTTPNGAQQLFTYDAQGRLASQVSGDGTGLVTYSYSSPGAVTVTDALGNKTTELYGANGAVAQVQDALGHVTQLQTNAAGELTSATTAGGSVSSYAYDSSGNLTSYTDPLGGTIISSYAANSPNLTNFTDQRGNQTRYSYDAAGNVTGITYQDGSGATYTYDAKGLLTTSTDANGNTTGYGYDGNGDLTSKLFADGTSDTYAYDTRGNLTAATSSITGTNSYTYDSANRLTSVTNPAGQVVSYTYNAQGELASRTLPNGSVTRDSYDALGRLSQLQDGSGNLLVRYTYNAAGELARTDTGNGASTTYRYDADGNVTEILDSNADGTVADRMDYTYNADGQVIEDATTDGVWIYGYDRSGQLTSAVFQSVNPAIANQSLTYVYDAAGNRVSQTVNGVTTAYTTNTLNQYTVVGGTTYTYDADGNTTSKTDSTGTTIFTYSQAGKLISEVGPSGTFQYAYDALGNLVSQTQNGVVSNYVNDPLSLSLTGQSLTSPAEMDDPNGTTQETYDYGLRLAAITNATGDTSYVDANLTGNVVGLSNSNGQRATSNFYLPFGQLVEASGKINEPFMFSGQFGVTTTAAGTINTRARSYSFSIGRFLSRDPIGQIAGSNEYTFANNNPILGSDPLGTDVLFFSGGGTKINGLGVGAAGGSYLNADAATGNIEFGTFSTPFKFGYGRSDGYDVQFGRFFGPLSGFEKLSTEINAGGGFRTGSVFFNNDGFAVSVGLGGATKSGSITEGYTITHRLYSRHIPLLVKLINFYPLRAVGELAIKIRDVVASAFGDPHLDTFDGLKYNFQTAGEFLLTHQSDGGNFDVQARISAPFNRTTYSVVTELAIQVGTDRVTIDSTRANVVWVNGAAATFTNSVDILAGGQITQMRSQYVVTLNTGESVTANIRSFGVQVGPGTSSKGIDVSIALNPFVEQPGTIEGLLGNANGDPTKDLTLADGTVLPTNMPRSELYGAYADSWRVTQASSLLDYGPNQTTDTFTDRNYPGQAVTLASFPAAQVATAKALAAQAGITDPGLQQDAAFDYLSTGDTSYIIAAANQQQQGSTTAAIADISTPASGSSVGVIAAAPTQVQAGSGATTADFQVYRSGDTSAALTVAYAVVAADLSFVGASAFGGTLPSGTISFAAGQTTADLPITLPAGIGALASQSLQVQITAPASTQVIGPSAQVQILNNAPVAGPAPSFVVELLDDETVIPTVSGNTWTFNLAGPTQGAASSTGTLTLAVLNAASLGADSFSGTISASGDGRLPATFTQRFDNLAPSALADIAVLNLAVASLAGGTATFTIALTETNATGYSRALPTETVIVQNPSTLIGPPVLTTPTSATVTASTATAIAGISLAETGSLTGETFTVTLTDTNGLLSAAGTGVQGSGSTALTITGLLSDVNADLATLQDTDATTPSDTIILNATDSLGSSATSAQIAITVQTIGGTSPTQPGGTTTGGGSSPGNLTPVTSAPVYRFFDSHTGTQFLTSSASERDTVLSTRPDLISEGVGLQAVVPAASDTTATPIYRFFDTIYGTHFYTSNGSERDTIVATRPDLTYEGVGFYEYASQQLNSMAVYRFFESTNGTHFYTSSADERSNILATRTDLVPEGIAFYAPAST